MDGVFGSDRRILVQRQVRADLIVIRRISRKNLPQVRVMLLPDGPKAGM